MDYFESDQFNYKGRTFQVRKYSDEDSGAPWERDDGHGPIREINSRDDKRPGERIFQSNQWRSPIYAYDWAAAMATARKEWGLGADETAKLTQTLGRAPTAGEKANRTVEMDYQRMRGWVRDDWSYIGVVVRIIGKNGIPEGDEFAHALWGIESDGDYWLEVAHELADEIMREKALAFSKRMREARERKYWAYRDVETMGA